MAVPVQCEQCQAKYLIEDRFAGKRAKCKRCGQVMSIPLPAGPGGSPALANDDTGGTGEMGMMDSPFGAPGPRSAGAGGTPPIPQEVTSQVPRSWRPQDVVVEREDDVTEFALSHESRAPRTIKPTSPGPEWLPRLLLLLFVCGVIGVGAFVHQKINAVASTMSAEELAARGGNPGYKIWVVLGAFVVGFFAVVSPLTLAGITLAGKILRFRLPNSAYMRACALASVPALVIIILLLSAFAEIADANLVAMLLLAVLPLSFVATRFLIGTSWLSTVAAWGGAVVLGGIGFVITSNGMNLVKTALTTTPKTPIARSSRPGSVARSSSYCGAQPSTPTVTSVAPTPSPTPPSPAPAPAPAPAPTPATATPQKPASALFDVDGLGDPAPAAEPAPAPNQPTPVAVAPVAPPNVPVAPVRIQPASPNGEPEERDTLVETALDDMKLRVKAAAGEAVTDVSAVSLKPDVIALVRPPGPSIAFAVVRRREGAKEEQVEIYTGNPPAKLTTASFAFEVAGIPNYAISADGQRLARVAEFPKLALRVTSPDGKEISGVDLDSKFGTPRLLGFLSADRVLVRWEKDGQFGLEVEDLKTHKHGRQIALPDHDAAACSNAISPDGRLFATAVRSVGKPVAVVVYNLVEGSRKQLVVKSLDPKWAIRPAGLAFSADGNKLAALFVQSGAAVIAEWNPKSGASLPDLTVSTAVQPLNPLPGSGEAGNAGGGGPGPAGANSLSWLGSGSALLACGSALIGAANGGGIADFGLPDVFGQSVVSENAVRVWYRDAQRPAGVLTITLDPKSLPAGSAPRAAPVPAGKR